MASRSRVSPDDVTPQALLAAFTASRQPESPCAARSGFIEGVLTDFHPEELPGISAADLAEVLAGFWDFAAPLGGDEPVARLVRARGEGGTDLKADLLEIVQADAPFLVDSVMGEIGEAGAEVLAMFHPVIEEGGRRRSMIQVWLAPVGEERQDRLVENVLGALADVRAAVSDFPEMAAVMSRAITDLGRVALVDPQVLEEDVEFLRWLDAGHFVYLGARTYEYPRTPDGGYAAEEPLFQSEASLGVLRDPTRSVLRRANEPAVLSANLRRRLDTAEPVVVAKSNLRSRVHRRVYMDYIGVRRYGRDGKPSGEVRFVGLFTAEAYDQSARDTPLLRRKVAYVMKEAGFSPGSHNAMRLANILETYPRDELFQIEAGELLSTAVDILHLSDRPKVKLFVRRDPFDRFFSILVYAPRERFDERFRRRAGDILAKAFGGRVSAYYPAYSDAPLARVYFVIGVTPGNHREPELARVEAELARAARTWGDDLERAIRAGVGEPSRVPELLAAYEAAFPPGYQDRYDATEAFTDLQVAESFAADDEIRIRAFRHAADSKLEFHFKLYRNGDAPVALAGVLPILQDMGLSALAEDGFPVRPRGAGGARRCVWIHEFVLEDENGEHLTFRNMKAAFENAFMAVWNGRTETDGFNRLVLELGASWREAALVRALARYRHQTGLDPSQAVQEKAVADHPRVVALILEFFAIRFDPGRDLTIDERRVQGATLEAAIEEALQKVESLDSDRVLRRLAALVGAITRTNYYQKDASGQPKSYVSFKVASRELTDLPSPKPFREIFVSDAAVEAVHLRFGPVARGGLRWSDRREDFRTEVLGLAKAQQVKNAVIVPVGAKGGFYPKLLPRGGDAVAARAAAVSAYKTFLRGMLDVTDNLGPDGEIIEPPDLVVHGGADTYLVVAADKGTATFSDIANEISAEYGFWLGDAFASGGSAGYDHKAMGITARGAWESVKRHFRELGKDIQSERVSVIGIGDMSGDVFGNGMLLSRTLRLKAAFDHRHIFLDPDPDPAVSWAERKRLFDLPASSWADYDASRISEGGGVFARALKSIPLSEPVRAFLDTRAEALSPSDLVCAILKARAELLYLGGIGTYVKAAAESNLDVGDKANDSVRVNGRELRCKVVGEGANLGFTQAGRIEFALAGGRIDTDAIDNSAGVDTSDHEVNIKILTGIAERSGALDPKDRDALLASMTDEVADHVLAHNYDQTLALSLLEAEAAVDLDSHGQFVSELEAAGRLDRALEGLPRVSALIERAKLGVGLTRPELAVLLAYGKLELFADIVASTAPNDPFFCHTLEGYFPTPLRHFESEMRHHPLRREIIATVVGNELVNLLGPTFPRRLRAAASCNTDALVTAFEAARRMLGFSEVWERVAALDGKAPAAGQTALFRELAYVLRGQTYWLARRAGREAADVRDLVEGYQPAVDVLKRLVPAVLSPFEQKAAVKRAAVWIKAGAPKDIAHSIALMRPLNVAANLSDLAEAQRWSLANTAYVYHKVGGSFGFDRLRAAAGARTGGGDVYERLAVRRLIEDLFTEQTALAGAVMSFAREQRGGEDPARDAAAVGAWSAAHSEAVKLARRTIEEIEKAGGGWSLAKLTIANGALRRLSGG
jgi:glutamate dehydrogenase